MKTPVLEVTNVEKTYGRARESQFHALKGISFYMEEGEFVGIMGPSGSGKTTLLNTISTLDSPSGGSIKVSGTEITQMKQGQLAKFRSEKLGFIFQDFNLLENLNLYENIALPLSLQGKKGKHIRSQVHMVAEKLGIEDLLEKYPVAVSGGQKQRAAAARAIVHNPSMLLADEPTGALDTKSAKSLLDAMKALNEQHQVSIMMVTHDPFTASYCQRVLFIQDGQLYKTLERTASRQHFYQTILDVLSDLGASRQID
ncbi:ABC transporter ATP-binding protein [Aureibacillus halotolerans]|uniref:Putative ABC transport system ATP-binding protein n=1 Tax=Aureibacillus halotolerans TaxID=1508390 RepID=A0A4R6U619_9BACI|nr:ABC transporter ATP-binding protein [Aureibacillus halotolerans]TDQ41022.1 putative ABC transport system ATP-binding protein [Aureibacillus halotolerans]